MALKAGHIPFHHPRLNTHYVSTPLKGRRRRRERNNIPHTQEFWLNPLTVIHRQPKRDEKAFILSTLFFFIFVGRALWGFVIVCAGANRPRAVTRLAHEMISILLSPTPFILYNYFLAVVLQQTPLTGISRKVSVHIDGPMNCTRDSRVWPDLRVWTFPFDSFIIIITVDVDKE